MLPGIKYKQETPIHDELVIFLTVYFKRKISRAESPSITSSGVAPMLMQYNDFTMNFVEKHFEKMLSFIL